MGLEINIRYRNIYTGEIIEDFDEFGGKGEFKVIKEWINLRKGYIALNDYNYSTLIGAVENELLDRVSRGKQMVEENEFPYFLMCEGYGLEILYAKLLKAPLFLKLNWVMEIKCYDERL